jgi:hypothetical protein
VSHYYLSEPPQEPRGSNLSRDFWESKIHWFHNFKQLTNAGMEAWGESTWFLFSFAFLVPEIWTKDLVHVKHAFHAPSLDLALSLTCSLTQVEMPLKSHRLSAACVPTGIWGSWESPFPNCWGRGTQELPYVLLTGSEPSLHWCSSNVCWMNKGDA